VNAGRFPGFLGKLLPGSGAPVFLPAGGSWSQGTGSQGIRRPAAGGRKRLALLGVALIGPSAVTRPPVANDLICAFLEHAARRLAGVLEAALAAGVSLAEHRADDVIFCVPHDCDLPSVLHLPRARRSSTIYNGMPPCSRIGLAQCQCRRARPGGGNRLPYRGTGSLLDTRSGTRYGPMVKTWLLARAPAASYRRAGHDGEADRGADHRRR